MTQRTSVSDRRTVVYSKGNPLQVGEYFSKSQNGSNLTPTERKMGRRPEHAYTCDIVSQFTELGNCHNWTTAGDDFLWTPRSWPPDNSIPDVWSNNDDLKLWNKLGARARQSEFNGGNFLAEFHQVPRMIGDIATKLAFVVHNIRHGNDSTLKKFFSKSSKAQNYVSDYDTVKKVLTSSRFYKDAGRNTSEKMSEGLLMFDYGISPLLSDAETFIAPLAQQLNDLPYHSRVKSQRVVRNSGKTQGFIWSVRSIHRVGFRAYMSSPPSGLTLWHLNDPLSALWEVMPWSFVVDWALPIGQYLGAHDTFRSFNWDSIWKSTFIERTEQFVGLDPSVLRPGASFTGGQATFNKYVSMKREQLDLSSIAVLPTPAIRPLKEVASVKHSLDAIALLIGQKAAIAKSMKF